MTGGTGGGGQNSAGYKGLTKSDLVCLLEHEQLSFQQIADRYGVNRQTIANYARRWGLRSTHPAQHPGRNFTMFRGRRVNLNQVAAEAGIDYAVVYSRFQRGDRGEQLARPVQFHCPKPDVYELGISYADWLEYASLAREVGIKTAANRTGLPYGALAAAVRGEWERLG